MLGTPRDEQAVSAVVGELLDLFGPRRCLFGSNFPVERMAGDYVDAHRIMLRSLRNLTDDERGDVLAGTARRVYRII